MANENNIKPWNTNKHYKVGEVISYLSANWRNDTGHNSEPGLNPDWFIVKEATTPGAQSGLSALEGAYNFSTLTSGDPGSGKALLNNADPLIATAVHISNTDNNGLSNNYYLLGLKAGDLIALNDKSTGKKYSYRLTNVTTDGTGYTILPVQLVEVVGVFADTDELVTEAIFTGGVEILRQKTINGNYTLTADDDKYYIYLELVANAIITVDSSVLPNGFVCEFENLSDFEAKFIGDISPVESTNDPIYLVGDTLNKDDYCTLRREAAEDLLRLTGQLTFGGEVIAYDERVSADGGTIGDILCLTGFDNLALLDLIPNGWKEKILYSIVPNSGIGDFAVSRASKGSFINSLGNLEFAPIDVPRMSYENGIDECPVLLSEDQSINLITYSEDITNSNWSKIDALATPNAEIGRDGILSMDKVESSNSGSSRVQKLQTVTALSDVSISFDAKAGNIGWVLLMIIDGGNQIKQYYDLENGVLGAYQIVGTPVSSNIQIKKFGDIYRCYLTYYAENETPSIGFYLASDDLNTTTEIGDYMNISQAQVEQQAKATSYIKTTGVAETRMEDVINVTVPVGATQVIETINNIELAPQAVVAGNTYEIPKGKINRIKMIA